MKVLLRSYENEPFVWKEAERNFNNDFVVDGKFVSETSIISVAEMDKNKFVKCENCGSIISNNSRAIKEHRNISCDWKNCLKCKYLRIKTQAEKSKGFIRNENGNFDMTVRSVVSLQCGNLWNGKDILNDDARTGCHFAGCKNAKMLPADDFFSKNPDAFDDMITVDKIVKNGYTQMWKSGDYACYELKARNRIYAYVNKFNIVEKFRIQYRYNDDTVVYSKKLDEIFSINRNGKYAKPNIWGMPDESLENVRKKIASLYN